MAKKKEEVKEAEKLTEEVTTEETKNEEVTTTEETTEEVKEVKKETKKTLVANTSFNDKYTGEKYTEKTEFIVVNEDITTTKVKDNQYKISAKRAEEIKAKGYID